MRLAAHFSVDVATGGIQVAKRAQMSVAFPVVPRSVKLLKASDLYTTRPTYSVVVGPAGTSVGNKMSTICPVVTTRKSLTSRVVVCVTDPLDF